MWKDITMDSEQAFEDYARDARRRLETRGLEFERTTVPDGEWTFTHPRRWALEWRDDYAVLSHGRQGLGRLSIFPIDPPRGLRAADLMDAWLNEFLEPRTSSLTILDRGPHPHDRRVEWVEALFEEEGRDYHAGILTRAMERSAALIVYQVGRELFDKDLVDQLLAALLVEVRREGDDPSGRRGSSLGTEKVPPAVLLRDAGAPPLQRSFAAKSGRFALRLPEGWHIIPIRHEGDEGWLLRPGEEDEWEGRIPFIVITGERLTGPLEETLAQAVDTVVEADTYSPELPPASLDLGDRKAYVQLFGGTPSDAQGRYCRLWSFGVSDSISVVHLLAAGDAEALDRILAALTALARSIRVLPPTPDPEKTAALVGRWRALDTAQPDQAPRESILELFEDGSYVLCEGETGPEEQKTEPPQDHLDAPHTEEGRWRVCFERLVLQPTETVEHPEKEWPIAGIEAGAAILDGVFWKRIEG